MDCENWSGALNEAVALCGSTVLGDGGKSPICTEACGHGCPPWVFLVGGSEREIETKKRESDLCDPGELCSHVVCSDWLRLVSSPGTCSGGLCRPPCV